MLKSHAVKRFVLSCCLGVCLGALATQVSAQGPALEQQAKPAGSTAVSNSLGFEATSLEGKKIDLAKKYQKKVVMIVNVASQCGLTPQYEQLEALHEKYAKQGLAVLGFPCNQFGKQEPGSSAEIQSFCRENYGVKFDMFEKIDVNGEQASDLYKHLTKLKSKPKGAGKVSWNFEKFLIDRSGTLIARFSPQTKPNAPEVVELIETSLKQ